MKKIHQTWLNNFLENYKVSNKSEHTIINYRADLMRFISWYELHYPTNLNRANAKVITEYKSYLSSSSTASELPLRKRSFTEVLRGLFKKKSATHPSLPRSPHKSMKVASRRRHLSTIKNFYDFLKESNDDDNKLFETNPVRPKLHAIKLKDEDVEHTQLLTLEDWQAINNYVYSPKDRFIVNLLFFGGLRLSELCELKVKNFDKNKKCITFVRKGGYVHKLFIQKGDFIFELFELHLKTRKSQSEFVFINNVGKGITSRGMYNTIMKIIRRSHCPTPLISPHSFRKACATNLYQKTKDLLFVRDYLNHSDAKVTQTYIEVSEA